jgi:hypothetical protein
MRWAIERCRGLARLATSASESLFIDNEIIVAGPSNLRSTAHPADLAARPNAAAARPELRCARRTADDCGAQKWWSRRESNPRPQAFVGQIYMLSWLIWF